LFKKVTLSLENGKTVTVNASNSNRYVDKLMVNGKPYTKTWLSHRELMKGAVLDFTMSATPNKQRGIREEDAPYSFSDEK
jgi:putative alpha-1,2-mannosidase